MKNHLILINNIINNNNNNTNLFYYYYCIALCVHTYRDDIGLSPVAELVLALLVVVLKNIRRLIIWLDDEDDENK